MKTLAIAALLLTAGPALAQPSGPPPPPPAHGPHHPAPPPGHGARPAPPRPMAGEDHAHAAEGDRREIMAVVDRMFAALTAKDSAALLAEVVPEGRATANILGPRRGIEGAPWPQFVAHLGQMRGRPVERLIDPHVHVEGDIAMIWSRYEFELDGRFLHCGVDHFDLIRDDGRWRVLNLTWTQQTDNCPGRQAAPRGPQGDRG